MNSSNTNATSKRKTTMIIDGINPDMIKVALLGNNQLYDLEYHEKCQYGRGSIHLGVITKVLPSLQAVFVRYKKDGKDGFLSFSEIDPAYFSKITNEWDEDDSQNDLLNEELEINLNEEEINDEELLVYGSAEIDEEIDNKEEDIHAPQGFLCKDQVIVVQVVKEERDTKGATLSSFITLNGRYSIFMPNRPNRSGISRNASNLIDRRRLQLILNNLQCPANSSIVISSTGIRCSAQEIKQDYKYLVNLWDDIKKKSNAVHQAPNIIYHELNLIRSIFYNINNLNVKNIIIEGEQIYYDAINFARSYTPDYLNFIKLHNLDLPIFAYYGVDDLVNDLFSNTVSLKSGGYLVIDKTEALISIDVNSGKSNNEANVEETALRTNLEAIQECMTQIKLRKMSGLIVIDLIGMKEYRHNKIIEGIAKRMSQYDKSKMLISMIDEFGLLIISRQRLGQSIFEIQSEKCQYCAGRGFARAPKFVIANIFNEIKISNAKYGIANFNILAGNNILLMLMNEYREQINETENKIGCKINLVFNHEFDNLTYKIDRTELPKVIYEDSEEASELKQEENIESGIESGVGEILVLENRSLASKYTVHEQEKILHTEHIITEGLKSPIYLEKSLISSNDQNIVNDQNIEKYEKKSITHKIESIKSSILIKNESAERNLDLFEKSNQSIVNNLLVNLKCDEDKLIIFKVWNEWLDNLNNQ